MLELRGINLFKDAVMTAAVFLLGGWSMYLGLDLGFVADALWQSIRWLK